MEPTDRPGPRNRATRWTARLGLAGVSAIAAVVSYFHALAVVQRAGARPPVAYLVPFLADLVILGASAALLDASRSDDDRPPLATVALVAGIGVTLAMNVAAGWGNGLAGALVAGWPAVAFILALESLASILRRGRGALSPSIPGDPPATLSHPEPLSTEAALRALLDSGSQRALAELLRVDRSRVQDWRKRLAPVAEDSPAATADAPTAAGRAAGSEGRDAATPDRVPAALSGSQPPPAPPVMEAGEGARVTAPGAVARAGDAPHVPAGAANGQQPAERR